MALVLSTEGSVKQYTLISQRSYRRMFSVRELSDIKDSVIHYELGKLHLQSKFRKSMDFVDEEQDRIYLQIHTTKAKCLWTCENFCQRLGSQNTISLSVVIYHSHLKQLVPGSKDGPSEKLFQQPNSRQ